MRHFGYRQALSKDFAGACARRKAVQVTGTIQGVHVENYATFRNAGYVDPFVDAAAPVCSWCADNPLVRDGNSEIIDHVLLVRTPDASAATPAREFTDPVTLQTEAGPVTSRLSDHYGVSVRLEWP